MNGIYIPGMEMPKNCMDCPLCYDEMECCVAHPIINFFRAYRDPEDINFDMSSSRHPRCPLITAANVVERKEGEWLETWHKLFKRELLVCSYCGSFTAYRTNFCQNCGADMRKGGEKNET